MPQQHCFKLESAAKKNTFLNLIIKLFLAKLRKNLISDFKIIFLQLFYFNFKSKPWHRLIVKRCLNFVGRLRNAVKSARTCCAMKCLSVNLTTTNTENIYCF